MQDGSTQILNHYHLASNAGPAPPPEIPETTVADAVGYHDHQIRKGMSSMSKSIRHNFWSSQRSVYRSLSVPIYQKGMSKVGIVV
jgi:hypothetical protein